MGNDKRLRLIWKW